MTAPVVCAVCEHARLHGSWPSSHRGTHCRDCHRSWTSRREAHCVVCHEQFGSNGAADQHWVGGRHVPAAEATRRDGVARLVRRDTPNGSMWVQPMDEARLESLRSARATPPNSPATVGEGR